MYITDVNHRCCQFHLDPVYCIRVTLLCIVHVTVFIHSLCNQLFLSPVTKHKFDLLSNENNCQFDNLFEIIIFLHHMRHFLTNTVWYWVMWGTVKLSVKAKACPLWSPLNGLPAFQRSCSQELEDGTVHDVGVSFTYFTAAYDLDRPCMHIISSVSKYGIENSIVLAFQSMAM